MPRASWRGHLRLSLVSCPIYLSPATARTKSIRLHQVWQAPPAGEPDEQPDRERGRDLPDLRASGPHSDQVEHRTEPVGPVSRITLRPHDPTTGEEVEKDEVVRGYEYQRGQYVTFTPDELKALDLESSKVIDLEMFVPRGDVDAVYFNSPYYLYPDGQMAVEAVRVIGAAMGEASVVGIGRLTMSRRERMVMVEPHGSGMVLMPPTRFEGHSSARLTLPSMRRCWPSPARSSNGGPANSIRASSEIATRKLYGS